MRFSSLGPGVLITAAFIGPGTLTLCTLAGTQMGLSLLWVVLLAVLLSIFIQQLVAQMAWKTELGLAEMLLQNTQHPILRIGLLFLVLTAILVGNAAYEGGNLAGAQLGFQSLVELPHFSLGSISISTSLLLLGLLAGGILWWGSTNLIKKILLAVVGVMSISFLIAALLVQPPFLELLKGLLLPQWPKEQIQLVVGLLGTTIVPYNLFLHAHLVQQQKQTGLSLSALRQDTQIAIGVGGLISMCIVIAASSMYGSSLQGISDLGSALVPLYGSAANTVIALGLLAAGMSSAITAPLAAGKVAAECFGWHPRSAKTRGVALFVLVIGLAVVATGWKPIQIIRLAQWANGLLLPLIAAFLFYLVLQQKRFLGLKTTTLVLLGGAVVVFLIFSLRSLGFL
jgi:manganese transport protein